MSYLMASGPALVPLGTRRHAPIGYMSEPELLDKRCNVPTAKASAYPRSYMRQSRSPKRNRTFPYGDRTPRLIVRPCTHRRAKHNRRRKKR
uniref:Secreted protein n=1 Tax=Globodera pallida TaxID=36090 RepID=A0A183CPZ4_GLOPA